MEQKILCLLRLSQNPGGSQRPTQNKAAECVRWMHGCGLMVQQKGKEVRSMKLSHGPDVALLQLESEAL